MTYSRLQNAMLLIARLIIAAIFIYAGYAKFALWNAPPSVIPAPMLLLMRFLAFAEPLGGIALVAGFLTRTASICLSIIMVGAIGMLIQAGFAPATGAIGWSYPLAVLAGCLLLSAFGAGDWSVEGMRKSR